MVAITADCPCAVRGRKGASSRWQDPEEAVPPDGDAVCLYCGRIVKFEGGVATRAAYDDEVPPPGDPAFGPYVAARARSGQYRGGRPFDNAPPRDPKPRP